MLDLADPEVLVNLVWRPTPTAFAAYRKREVEMARANLRMSKTTLHSTRTMQEAASAS